MNLTVSIGRRDNVNGLALSNAEWATFKRWTLDIVSRIGDVVTEAEGVGYYEDQAEDTYTVTVVLLPWIFSASVDKPSVGYARECVTHATNVPVELALLAERFDQDSIVWGVWEPLFATPPRRAD